LSVIGKAKLSAPTRQDLGHEDFLRRWADFLGGFGEERKAKLQVPANPVADNDTAVCRQHNRRVEIIVSCGAISAKIDQP
jgi:hypothetical protein